MVRPPRLIFKGRERAQGLIPQGLEGNLQSGARAPTTFSAITVPIREQLHK